MATKVCRFPDRSTADGCSQSGPRLSEAVPSDVGSRRAKQAFHARHAMDHSRACHGPPVKNGCSGECWAPGPEALFRGGCSCDASSNKKTHGKQGAELDEFGSSGFHGPWRHGRRMANQTGNVEDQGSRQSMEGLSISVGNLVDQDELQFSTRGGGGKRDMGFVMEVRATRGTDRDGGR
jgi:hypothetical protein